MGMKLQTAALAATVSFGLMTAPAAAAPVTLDLIGEVVSATGNWSEATKQIFTSVQTIDDDENAAELIEYYDALEDLVAMNDGSGLTDPGGTSLSSLPATATKTWWIFEGPPDYSGYGVNFNSPFLGGPLLDEIVWVETTDNFEATVDNNDFGIVGTVDAVTISGGNVIATCNASEQNGVGFCPPNSSNNDGTEFSITYIATSDWFTGIDVFPSTDPETLLAIWGEGIQFTDGDVTATALIEFQAVPLPAALPMFIAGLGMLGLFGWRRNRAA